MEGNIRRLKGPTGVKFDFLVQFAGDANIENVGEVFWRKLVKVFDKNGWKLIRLEIGENPLRVYAVSVKEIRL
mgnify:CR=1 FL=1